MQNNKKHNQKNFINDVVTSIDISLLSTEENIKDAVKLWSGIKDTFLFGEIENFKNKPLLVRLQGLRKILLTAENLFISKKIKNEATEFVASTIHILNDAILVIESLKRINDIKENNNDAIQKLLQTNFNDKKSIGESVKLIFDMVNASNNTLQIENEDNIVKTALGKINKI